MIPRSELYDKFLSFRKERKTGRAYVYVEDGVDGVRVISITLKEGEIIDLVDRRGKNGSAVTEFWDLAIRNITFIASSIPDNVSKNPSAPDLADVLNRIGETPRAAGGNGPVNHQPTGQLWALSRKIDRSIARKGLDIAMTRGQIGLQAGVLMNFDQNTPDDIVKITAIKKAVKEILGEDL